MSEGVFPLESVYNLIPKEEVHVQTPRRYISKYRPKVVLEKKSTQDAMRTMGPAKVEPPSPEKYLKKHSKEPKLPEKIQCSKEVRHTCGEKKPAVPARTDNPPMGTSTKRDFVKTATVTAVPMRPRPVCVDSRKGHKQLLENSGLVPKYTKKKHYGEVPEYLQRRTEGEQRAQEEHEEFVREQREQGGMKRLSDEERRAILEDLKKSWDKLHHEYQGLPLVIETLKTKSHKDQLDKAMKQLEKDIALFERFQTIYVANNQETVKHSI